MREDFHLFFLLYMCALVILLIALGVAMYSFRLNVQLKKRLQSELAQALAEKAARQSHTGPRREIYLAHIGNIREIAAKSDLSHLEQTTLNVAANFYYEYRDCMNWS